MDHLQLAASLLARSEFEVIAWRDPICDDGIPADSDDALVLLCPVIGPSGTIMLHRLARYASAAATTWEPSVFAATFGLSTNNAGLAAKTIARLARFGLVTIGTSTLAVRTRIPRLPHRWIGALPEYLRQGVSWMDEIETYARSDEPPITRAAAAASDGRPR